MDYLVSWEIEVTAENPVDAARQARAAQAQPGTRSTLFCVHNESTDEPIRVDLTAIAEERRS